MSKLPPLLENNPEFKTKVEKYAIKHLDELSTELLLSYLYDTTLLELLEEKKIELANSEYSTKDMLNDHGLKNIGINGS